jgi:TRAP transporter TAXI family solute receptor
MGSQFMFRVCAVILLVAGLSAGMPREARSVEGASIIIGTGGVTGVYYPAGGAICRLVNKGGPQHGIRCSVESTGGSVANINGIREGALEFGLVQSDWQYYAYSGAPVFSEQGPFADLRSVFSLHVEPFTVIARADSGIRKFSDIKGKRVNIGNPGSGQRGTMDIVLNAVGWTVDDFASVTELSSDEQSQALCKNKIDAMVFVVGHPSASIKEATTTCASVLVDASQLEALVRGSAFYRKAKIPGGMYAGTKQDIFTFGVYATLVTSGRVPDEIVYQLVKAVFGDFAGFKRQHPAFKDLTAQEMSTAGLTAPLHPGAIRYYKQAGWR